MLALVGPWLLKNWKLVAVASACLALLIYVGTLKYEVAHYKAKAEAIEAKYTLYKEAAEAKEAKLEAGAAEISKRHEHALAEASAQRDIAAKATQEKIAANEELKRTRISLDAVRLLNESTSHPEEPAAAVSGNAPSTAGTPASTTSLDIVFGVVAENNKKHLACVAQVKEWITFWNEYTAVVKDAINASP